MDPVPAIVRSALSAHSNTPGYPTVWGTADLREAYVGWLARAHGVAGLDPHDVLPTIGSKEAVAALPTQLGIGTGDVVCIPEIAYPTYEVGANLAGAKVVRGEGLSTMTEAPALIWLNSPSNPTGKVLSTTQLAKIVGWARRHGAIVLSDECYIDLGWENAPVSVLHEEVSGGDHTGILALHSLSKRSNMAGYRVAFVSGDEKLVAGLLALRRHVGAMVPAPIQAAATAALDDDAHVAAQRNRYSSRRTRLIEAFEAAGFSVSHSEAGLYLWCTRGEPAMTSVNWLAERGILCAPGTFYGPAGAQHIRVAFTATDERVAAGCARLMA